MPEILILKLCVIDEWNIYGGKLERFPILKELLTLAWLAWSKYQDYLESKAAQQDAKSTIQERESNLVDIFSKKKV